MESLINFIFFLLTGKKKKSVNYQTSFSMGENKTVMTSAGSLELTQKTELKKIKLNEEIEEILFSCEYNPQKILKYISAHGTRVYKIPFPRKVLKFVDEEEGFISPEKGIKALVLNFVINLIFHEKFSIKFSTPEMYLMGEDSSDIYSVVYNFHKWYTYKNNLPGYDYKSQNRLKKMMKLSSKTPMKDFAMQEVFNLQEAINRDKEAISFMTKFAQKTEKLKSAMSKLTAEGGANI